MRLSPWCARGGNRVKRDALPAQDESGSSESRRTRLPPRRVSLALPVRAVAPSEVAMRQLTYIGPNRVDWWDVPEPQIQSAGDAIVQPLAVTRCDLDLYIVN